MIISKHFLLYSSHHPSGHTHILLTQPPWRLITQWLRQIKKPVEDLPGGTVEKNPPANTGDAGLIPGPGRFHMPRSN